MKTNDPTNKRDGQKKTVYRDYTPWLHSLQLSQEACMKHPRDTWSKQIGSDMHSVIPGIRQKRFCKPHHGALRLNTLNSGEGNHSRNQWCHTEHRSTLHKLLVAKLYLTEENTKKCPKYRTQLWI